MSTLQGLFQIGWLRRLAMAGGLLLVCLSLLPGPRHVAPSVMAEAARIALIAAGAGPGDLCSMEGADGAEALCSLCLIPLQPAPEALSGPQCPPPRWQALVLAGRVVPADLRRHGPGAIRGPPSQLL